MRILTLVDYISHKKSPFDLIDWYAIVHDEKTNEYFFENIQTSEYEPIHMGRILKEQEDRIQPLTSNHIEIYFKIYEVEKSKMERKTYNKIRSIQKFVDRENKINQIINEGSHDNR